MLKIMGSIMIIAASVGLAFCIRRDMKEHLCLLYEIRKMLIDISSAAEESMQPVEILLGCFVRTKDVRLNQACSQIAEKLIEKKEGRGEVVWKMVFEQYRPQLQLTQEEGELLEQAGCAFFGKSMQENQKHLNITLERLNFLLENTRKEQKEKQKVYQTVTIVSGLMLVLLLL